MAEKHYVFMLNGRAENVLLFAEQDDELATRICNENNYDGFHWIGEDEPPTRWSEWSNRSKSWIPPDEDYLVSIGVMQVIKKPITKDTKNTDLVV